MTYKMSQVKVAIHMINNMLKGNKASKIKGKKIKINIHRNERHEMK